MVHAGLARGRLQLACDSLPGAGFFHLLVALRASVRPFSAMGDPQPTIDAQRLAAQAGWLKRLALRLVRDEGRADELAQEALGQAWISQPRGGAEEPVLRAWLSRALRNSVRGGHRESARRRQREGRVARPEGVLDPASAPELAENARLVLEAVLGLAEPYRATVLLRYYEGFTAVQIAQKTGAQPGVVRKRLSRAHDQLRERLSRSHPGGEADWRALVLAWALPESATTAAGLPLQGLLMSAKTKVLVLAALLTAGTAWLAWRAATPGVPVVAEPAQVANSLAAGEVQLVDPGDQRVPAPRSSTEEAAAAPDSAGQGVWVRGHVKSSEPGALEDVAVRVGWMFHGAEQEVLTQVDGNSRYAVRLAYPLNLSPHARPHCRPRVAVRARGHLPARGEARPAEGGGAIGHDLPLEFTLDLTLDSGPVGEGRVLTSAGLPVPQASVVSFDASGELLERVRTDAGGHYTVSLPAEGAVRLVAHSLEHGVAVSPTFPVEPGEDLAFPVLVCRQQGSIQGQVVLPTGQPLAGVQVRAYPAASNGLEESYSSATRPFHAVDAGLDAGSFGAGLERGMARSGADGSFCIGGLIPGDYLVTTMTHGPEETPHSVATTGDELRIDVEAYVLRVQVNDAEGKHLPNAELRLASESMRVYGGTFDATGTYETFLNPEPWTVEVEVPGAAPVVEVVDVLPGVYEYGVLAVPDFEAPVGELILRAQDANGDVLAVRRLELARLVGTAGPVPEETLLHSAELPDETGRLTLPAGRYAFEAGCGDPRTGLYAPESGTFLIREGQSTELVLRPEAWARIELALRPVGGDRQTMRKDLNVTLDGYGGGGPQRLRSFSRSTSEGGWRMQFAPSLDGEPEITVRLRPGATNLRLEGPGIRPIAVGVQLEAGAVTRVVRDVLPAGG